MPSLPGWEADMIKGAQLTERTGMAVYVCDQHNPWQSGLNENINGLLRQHLPRGADLSTYTQEQLDEIAWSLNKYTSEKIARISIAGSSLQRAPAQYGTRQIRD